MKFLGCYDYGYGKEYVAISARNEASAKNFLYDLARDGLICKELSENREFPILELSNFYISLEPFDYNSKRHLNTLKEQEANFWEV